MLRAECAEECPRRGAGFTLRAVVRGLGVLCVGLGCGCYAAPAEDKALPTSASAAAATDAQEKEVLVPELIPHPGRPEGNKPHAAVELPPNAKLDAVELQRAIDGRFGKLQGCIREDSVAKVSMKVAAGGELTQVRVLTSQPDSPILRDCVETALKGTRLANSRGSDDRPVVVTLSLRKDG